MRLVEIIKPNIDKETLSAEVLKILSQQRYIIIIEIIN
jgi:hypothetical protein